MFCVGTWFFSDIGILWFGVFCALSIPSKRTLCGVIIIVLHAVISLYIFPLFKKLLLIFFNLCKIPKTLSKIGLCSPLSLSNFHSMAYQNSQPVVHDHTSTTRSSFHRKLPIAKRRAPAVRYEKDSSSALLKRPVPSCSETWVVFVFTSYYLLNIISTFIIICPPICPIFLLYIQISQ